MIKQKTIPHLEELLMGALPCQPEEIQPLDRVVAIFVLGTRIALRNVFSRYVSDDDLWKEVDATDVFGPPPKSPVTLGQRRAMCEEAIDDLQEMAGKEISNVTSKALRRLLQQTFLKDDPTLPPGFFNLRDRNADYLLRIPLRDFHLIGRIPTRIGTVGADIE